MEKKRSGRPSIMKKYIERHEPEPQPVSEAAPPPKPTLHAPDGYTSYPFIAVSKHTQHLIFSNDGENWCSFDGLPVR